MMNEARGYAQTGELGQSATSLEEQCKQQELMMNWSVRFNGYVIMYRRSLYVCSDLVMSILRSVTPGHFDIRRYDISKEFQISMVRSMNEDNSGQ